MDEYSSVSSHLLQFSPDALLVVDTNGRIVYANPTAHQLFGYSGEQLIGQPLDLLVPDRYRLRHGAHLSSFLAQPSNREMGARLVDLFARRADGSEFPAGIRLAPFQENGQMLVGAAVRDMTERRAISDALVAAREDAERANHAKTRFLATASHDLRQPLQTIRLLNASLLNLTASSAEVHDLLEHQERAIDIASRMLNALLDITRLESGAIEPQLAPVSLAATWADLAREFESLAGAKRLKLEFPLSAPITLSTDRVLFSQLMQNLLGNAIKYTDTGFVRVTASNDLDGLTVTVEDSGVGIPEDKLERIFDEYYQVDLKGRQRSGVGLGLAIVRELARLLGYSVSIVSRLGEGTCARVRIPAQRLLIETAPAPRSTPSPAGVGARASGQTAGAGAAADVSRPRIILLEDNDSVRMATELFLSLEGHEVIGVASVAEAEPVLAHLGPEDLLISDYHLDGAITGLQVLEQVRALKRRDVPAILLTGDLQALLRVVKGEMRRCRFLSKPVDTQALLESIRELRAEEPASTAAASP
ncbi:MAG TPA: ATP-binding protein [Steroidobacteraceae bacterium]|nr:ATP-binding protein [Steroidobacteraceae bacterium]